MCAKWIFRMPDIKKLLLQPLYVRLWDERFSKMTCFNFSSIVVSLTIRCCEYSHVICANEFESYPHKVTNQYHCTGSHQRIHTHYTLYTVHHTPIFLKRSRKERETKKTNQWHMIVCCIYCRTDWYRSHTQSTRKQFVTFRCVYVFQMWDVHFVKSSLRFVMYSNVVAGRLHIIWRHIIW